MFKALRKAAVTIGLKKSDDQDTADKKRLSDLRDANEAVKKNLASFLKVFQDYNTHAASLHESFVGLYPHAKEQSPRLETIVHRAEHFKSAKNLLEEGRVAIEAAYSAVATKHKDLSKLADERAGFRQDIFHYEEKLEGLKLKVAQNVKDAATKKDENEKKLEDAKSKFHDADAKLVPELEKLDAEVAAATGAAMITFLEVEKKFAEATAAVLAEALVATEVPTDDAPAAAGAGGDEAAAPAPAAAAATDEVVKVVEASAPPA